MKAIRHQVPLSLTDQQRWADLTLPKDLTETEAARLKAFIDALTLPPVRWAEGADDVNTPVTRIAVTYPPGQTS